MIEVRYNSKALLCYFTINQSSSKAFFIAKSAPNLWTLQALEGTTVIYVKTGSFSNDDGDGNQDVKKAIGLLRKTITLHVHHAFLYISSPSSHDYDVKMPNCKFYGGRKKATTNYFFSL